MNTEEYIPNDIPISRTIEKSLRVIPPNKRRQTRTKSTVNPVLIERAIVWRTLMLVVDSMLTVTLDGLRMFSLILSKITIVSFIEYPNIVSTAATKAVSTLNQNKADSPTVIMTSCQRAIMAATAYLNSNLNDI